MRFIREGTIKKRAGIRDERTDLGCNEDTVRV